MCGDSTKKEDVDKLMNGAKADLIVTDPPYGISYTGNPTGKQWTMIANDDKQGNELLDFLFLAFKNIADNSIENCPAYVYHAASTQPEFMQALKEAGFNFKQQIIWHKDMVLGMSHYHWEHEPVIYASKGSIQPPFYGDRTDKTVIGILKKADFKNLTKEGLISIIMSLKTRSSIFYQTQRGQEYSHPTQKPVGAMAPFIKNSSRPDEIVVDLFLGSGTTLVAAHQLDRKCYAMEFSKGYCDVVRKRYAKLVGEEHQWLELTKAIVD
jgi:DNA modification methylase